MRLPVLFMLGCVCLPSDCGAHERYHGKHRTSQPVDLIGPMGNRMNASYRRRYNRPTNIGGRLSSWIAPSSQEAMAWHAATHRGDYRCVRQRTEQHYFHAKPYEMLVIGPRRRRSETNRQPPAVKEIRSPLQEANNRFDLETEDFYNEDSIIKDSKTEDSNDSESE